MIDDFVRESQEELFDSESECLAWAKDHFDELVGGEVGGNLLSKYSMLGRFCHTQEALDYLHATIARTVDSVRGEVGEGPIDAVTGYLRAVMLHSPFRRSLAQEPVWKTAFDVEAWREAGYSEPIESFALPTATTYPTAVDGGRRSVIETRIEAFGDHPSGLGKFTRTMFAQDLRRTIVSGAN